MSLHFLDLPKREKKPRNKGITSLLDNGIGIEAVKDLIIGKEWIDVVKLGWGTPLVYPEKFLKKKIRLYNSNKINVSNGGTLLEIAFFQEKVDNFLEQMKKLGISIIEVSNGKMDIDLDEKAELIQRAKDYGFHVFSEVGKKDPILDHNLCLEDRIIEANHDLKAGASKVIMEARASGKLGIYDENCNVKEEFTKELVKGIGLDDIIFEAPQKNQQVWLILNFGPQVNLGNIKPEDVIPLETLRKGIRGDTFGEIS